MVLRVFFFVEALVVDGDDDVFCVQLMAIITCCSVCYTCPVYAPLCVCVCVYSLVRNHVVPIYFVLCLTCRFSP